MKKLVLVLILIFSANLLQLQKGFLLRGPETNAVDTVGNAYYSNSLMPGKESVEKLKKIIGSLIKRIDELSIKEPRAYPHFKYLEVKMPPRGKELKIPHHLQVDQIMNVGVNIINGTPSEQIFRSQVDLISQKVLFNWYVDKENFVLIRPNNVSLYYLLAYKLDLKENLFLESARLRIVFILK